MIFNDFEKVKNNYFELLGSGLGLAKPEILIGNRNSSKIKMSIMQLSIPSYFKIMNNTLYDMSYHISGYGQSNEEALTRCLGETVERYSFMSSHWLIKDRLITSTYNELKTKKEADVLPLEYINIFSRNDKNFNFLEKNDIVEWIKLKNYCNSRDIYYPIALISTDISAEKYNFPAMSTGTATHISYERALINALTEQLQIHLFMTSWYGLKKMPIIDLKKIPSSIKSILRETFSNNDIEIIVLDCSLEEINFFNYVTILKSKNRKFPYCAIGLQGGLCAEKALLRSIMEASAIYINLQEMYLYKEPLINKLNSKNTLDQYNLDAPFLFWANYIDMEKKEKILTTLIDFNNKKEIEYKEEFSIEKQLSILLKYFTKKLNYFSVIEISSLDSYKYGYKTVRCIAPELVTMNYPAMAYENHPYFKSNGGIKNGNFTHPLP